jgi:hypothetical protein
MELVDLSRRRWIKPVTILALTILVLVFADVTYPPAGISRAAGSLAAGPGNRATRAPQGNDAREAFQAAYKVLMHPRCMNCHPAGDVPLQGDDSHPHAQNVKRGPDGKGKYALKCANCHQEKNVPGENMPPGNPNWHLPPPEMPLVFQGKSPSELARQLKDPKQNGNKTLAQLLHHVSLDKLVLGCWDPGDGRTKPPLSHAEFARKMREWIEKGAPDPE